MTLSRFMRIFAILCVIALMSGCVRGYHATPGGADYDPAVCHYLRGASEHADFKGSGEITVAYGRQKQSGKIDVRAKTGGYFTARIYSPFGSIVAEAEAAEFKGDFKAGNERHDFSYDDEVNIPHIPIAPRFTYREFFEIITGGTPEFLRRLPPKPDTTSFSRRDAVDLWNAETLAVWVRTSRKTGKIISVIFDYGGAYVKIGKFDKSGMPKEIYIKDMDGNYINIKYETVRVIR